MKKIKQNKEPIIATIDIEKNYKMSYNSKTGVSEFWSFKKDKNGKLLKQRLNPDGYLLVKINETNRLVHGLIGKIYWSKKKGYSINHKNCNKLDNSLKNLEYITIAENIQHAIKNGMHVCNDPKRSGRYKDGRAIKSRISEYKHEWYENNKTK